MFPLHLWDRLLQQAELTLNLLRPARNNPALSAYAVMNGDFNFTATPLAPPGTKVLVHEKPEVRPMWATHGSDGWYLGPALEHYRCYRVYVTSTRAERISDTVEFFQDSAEEPYFAIRNNEAHKTVSKETAPMDTSTLITTTALYDIANIFDNSPQQKITEQLQPVQTQSAAITGVPIATNDRRNGTHKYPQRTRTPIIR